MPDISISNGDTTKIINKRQARNVTDDGHPIIGFLIYTTADIRIGTDDEREQIRHAHPIQQGTTFAVDPLNHEVYAYADGADAVVSVTAQKIRIGEMG